MDTLRVILLGWVACTCGVWGANLTDDFNDGNDQGWTRYDPLTGLGAGGDGIWDFPNGAYRLQASGALAPSSTGPARIGSYRTDVFAEFDMSVDFTGWDTDLDELFGLLARVTQPGLGTTLGYAFAYGTKNGTGGGGRFQIYRVRNEAGTTIAFSDYSLQGGHQYRFLFSGRLDQLHAEVYELSNSIPAAAPIVVLNASDSTYPSGYLGVFGYDNSRAESNPVDFTVDNFVQKRPVPGMSIGRGAENTTTIVWPRWATAYRLQVTPDLAHPTWDDVTWNLTQDATNNIFSDLSDGVAFFRLLAPQ